MTNPSVVRPARPSTSQTSPTIAPTSTLLIRLRVDSLPSRLHPLVPIPVPAVPPLPMASPRSVAVLGADWEFKRVDSGEFLPVAQFPTNVHLDLLHHGMIADPFFDKNELACQWVGETDWAYRNVFTAASAAPGEKKVLVFEGLDTYATVTLNGTEILSTDNMFIEYRADVTALLKAGENVLGIVFKSAFIEGKKVQEKYPDHHWGCWNGDPSRLAVRKAQYHYVWEYLLHVFLFRRSPYLLFFCRAGTGGRPS